MATLHRVTILGGPRDGEVTTVSEGVSELVIPEASSSFIDWIEEMEQKQDPTVPMPKYRQVRYKVTCTPTGLVAALPGLA